MMFIDGQNLYHAQCDYYGTAIIDYERFNEVLAGPYDLVRPYYFDSYRNEEDKQDFYHYLNMIGYRVEAEQLVERNNKRQEKGADIRLATELIAQGFNDSYDVAIVVSGDEDFTRAIKYVQDQGKFVVGAMFSNNMSGSMKPIFDRFIELDTVADRICRW